jgi:hypothetical protein
MTFDEIVAEIQTPFNLTSTASATRIGKWVNMAYKNLCSDFGIQTTSTVEGVAVNTTVGNRQMVFSASTTTPATGVERILSLYDATVTPNRPLIEISRDEMRNRPLSSDPASLWAVLYWSGAASVTINLNCLPATIYALTADVLSTKATLSGSDVPAFAEDFHDILIFYGQWREALKQQNWEAPIATKKCTTGLGMLMGSIGEAVWLNTAITSPCPRIGRSIRGRRLARVVDHHREDLMADLSLVVSAGGFDDETPIHQLDPDQMTRAINVELFHAACGERRQGMETLDLTGSSLNDETGMVFMGEHLPTGVITNAELWGISATPGVTVSVARRNAGVWATVAQMMRLRHRAPTFTRFKRRS